MNRQYLGDKNLNELNWGFWIGLRLIINYVAINLSDVSFFLSLSRHSHAMSLKLFMKIIES